MGVLFSYPTEPAFAVATLRLLGGVDGTEIAPECRGGHADQQRGSEGFDCTSFGV
jgi:hypothetical protein